MRNVGHIFEIAVTTDSHNNEVDVREFAISESSKLPALLVEKLEHQRRANKHISDSECMCKSFYSVMSEVEKIKVVNDDLVELKTYDEALYYAIQEVEKCSPEGINLIFENRAPGFGSISFYSERYELPDFGETVTVDKFLAHKELFNSASWQAGK